VCDADLPIHEAKTQLSKLIARAEAGEEVIIARGKDPVARLEPVAREGPRREAGYLKGKIAVPDSFWFDPLPKDESRLWRGSMAILLDSHAFFWWAIDDPKLSRPAHAAIGQDSEVYLSAVVAWEDRRQSAHWQVAGSQGSGRCPLRNNGSSRLRPMPISLEHAFFAGTLPGSDRDPFDRMLAAQAISEDMPLVTADPAFRAFDVKTLW
jgi:PIN domain nuclease of toxin-antitoxin system/antitoxin (DNA-binding transcriptional repressor) of toxin-antitoxin stability system